MQNKEEVVAVDSANYEMDLSLFKKQLLALYTPGKLEILYGGAAGGGKSHFIRVAAILIALGAPGSTSVILRRELKSVKANHMQGPTGLPALLSRLIDAKLVKIDNVNNIIRFKNGGPRRNSFNGGSTIHLKHLQRGDASLDSEFQGFEISGALLVDESTHLTAKQLDYLKSRVRLGKFRPPKGSVFDGNLPRIVYCTNPGGVSHEWHKNKFTYLEPYKVHKTEKSYEGDEQFDKMFIPAMVTDNPYIDRNYISSLNALEDPNERRALLFGDWSIASGTLFEESFKRHINVIESIELPEGSEITRSMDWGCSAPYSIIYAYICQEDETLKVNGELRTFPRGTTFVIDEIYGCHPDDAGKGLNIEDTEIGKRMRAFERAAFPNYILTVGIGDGHMFHRDNNRKMVIEDINRGYYNRNMANHYCLFKPYFKPAGSRELGARKINNMLLAAHKGVKMEDAGLFFTSNCRYSIDFLFTLPRDPNKFDCLKGSIDHTFDSLRYLVINKVNSLKTIKASVF